MGHARRRWLASEKIAFRLLEERGYRIVETNKPIVINDVMVAEIDAIAVDPKGDTYAVEVKAGRVDVNGLRQAFVNAQLIGAKPLVVCKGFADDAAKALASQLGIDVIELEDVFLVDSEELEAVVETAVVEALLDLIELIISARPLKPEEAIRMKALSESRDIIEAARRAGISVEDMANAVKRLKKETRLARGGWRGVRLAATLIVLRSILDAKLKELDRLIRVVEDLLEECKP